MIPKIVIISNKVTGVAYQGVFYIKGNVVYCEFIFLSVPYFFEAISSKNAVKKKGIGKKV